MGPLFSLVMVQNLFLPSFSCLVVHHQILVAMSCARRTDLKSLKKVASRTMPGVATLEIRLGKMSSDHVFDSCDYDNEVHC